MEREERQFLLIVDPMEVTRSGLSAMARSIPLVADVITSDDLSVAVRCMRTSPLTAMLLSGKFGGVQTEVLREEAATRGVKCLVTVHENDHVLSDGALDMVSHGILLLDSLTTEALDDALQCLALDHAVMPAWLLQEALRRRSSAGNGRMARDGFTVLTPREHQVLSLLSDGLSNKQIARRIQISEHGVKRHVANILAKLNCPSRTLAVSQALQCGILLPSRFASSQACRGMR